jgi:Pentapeptide repeats (9 copies)
MEQINYYYNKFKRYGFNESVNNISDFWFENKDKIQIDLKGKQPDSISCFIRWHSKIGIQCQEEVKKFINNKIKESLERRNELSRIGVYSFDYAIIDFNEFKFTFQENEYNLNTFCKTFDMSYYENWSDLRSIDLSGISFQDCILKNAYSADCNFSDVKMSQVKIENINFVGSNFNNSSLVGVQILNKTSFSSVNFNNSFLNAMDLSDNLLGEGIKYNEISYFQLLSKLFTKQDWNKSRNHTEFFWVQTNSIVDFQLKKDKEYIEWYMIVNKRIEELQCTQYNRQ